MDIRITQTWAKIGHWTENAKQIIKQPKADLAIEQVPAQLHIKTDHAQVIIDQRQCFAEAGLKNIFDLTRELAQQSRQIALQSIGDRAAEGDQMMRFEVGNAIGSIAQGKAIPEPLEWTIAFIPRSRPKIDFTGGVEIRVEQGGAKIEARANKPQIDATVGKVNYEMIEYNSIQFEYLGKGLDEKL